MEAMLYALRQSVQWLFPRERRRWQRRDPIASLHCMYFGVAARDAAGFQATLSFFQEFRRFTSKLTCDTNTLKQLLQEPAQASTKLDRT